MMGFTPKDIFKNKDNLKVFPVFDFMQISKDYEEINYSIVKNIDFNLYSVSKTMPIEIIPQIASPFWDEILARKDFVFGDKRYGIVEYDKFTEKPKKLHII